MIYKPEQMPLFPPTFLLCFIFYKHYNNPDFIESVTELFERKKPPNDLGAAEHEPENGAAGAASGWRNEYKLIYSYAGPVLRG